MSKTATTKIEVKVLAFINQLLKQNQSLRIKELFEIAEKKLKYPKAEIEQAIWNLIAEKQIVDGTKLTKPTLLINKNRQEILHFIFENPGANIRAIRTQMNMGSYLASWHLRMLEKFGYIWKMPYKNMILYFPFLIKADQATAFITLKDEKLSEINEFIFKNKLLDQQKIIVSFQLDEKTAQSYLEALLNADLIGFKEEKGTKLYWGKEENLKPILEYEKGKDSKFQELLREVPAPPKSPIKEVVTPIIEEKAPLLVEAVREYDYLGGNIRFKVAVRNNSPTTISKVRVILTPTDQFTYESEVKSLDILAPGESRGVDFLLTPLTCGKSQVFGTISYVNAFGVPNSFTVAPKEIWIKCPLVTSIKAELKDLLKWQSELQSGMSSLSFEGLTTQTAFEIVSDQISALDLGVVSKDNNTLKALYTGIAKVTNTKIIVEVETYEDAVKLVVWAADLNQVTGFLAYIKNLVNIALGMSKSMKMKEEKLGEKLLNAFEFSERLIQLFDYCNSNWALSEIIIILKEITRRLQRDISSIPLEISHWIPEFEKNLTPEALLQENAAINLQYDILSYLEKVAELIKSNLELYKSAFQENKQIIPLIEKKYNELLGVLTTLEKKYSRRILKFLLVIQSISGVTVFQHSFSDRDIDSDLISGFLTAIQSFGTEISTGGSSEMKRLAYKNFEIELNIGDYIRGALFLQGPITKSLVKNLVQFINSFERTYADRLRNWNGDVAQFEKAKDLVLAIFEKQ